jgi:hypothetical protein
VLHRQGSAKNLLHVPGAMASSVLKKLSSGSSAVGLIGKKWKSKVATRQIEELDYQTHLDQLCGACACACARFELLVWQRSMHLVHFLSRADRT